MTCDGSDGEVIVRREGVEVKGGEGERGHEVIR